MLAETLDKIITSAPITQHSKTPPFNVTGLSRGEKDAITEKVLNGSRSETDMNEFRVEWARPAVEALLSRVAAASLPRGGVDGDWSLGCDPAFVNRFRQSWCEAYDWRAAVNLLNQHPQFRTEIDGETIHFVHVVGEAGGRRPLLLIHGWPGSHFEFWKMIGPLAWPSLHGGQAEDAFDLVLPSLPGFGFSGIPRQATGAARTARLWDALMRSLGYPQYLVHGGDFGGIVAAAMGRDPESGAKAIHVTMPGFTTPDPPADEAEAAWLEAMAESNGQLGGYSHLQSTRPLSLGWILADAPLGQATWILERFHDWTDLGERTLDAAFGMDELITSVMLYVMTDRLASSVLFYHASLNDGGYFASPGARCDRPTGYCAFPGDPLFPVPPRSRIARLFNLIHWTEAPRGGHFAGLEEPDFLAKDIVQWARILNRTVY